MSLEEIENIIKDMIKEDSRVSRKDIAMTLGVGEKKHYKISLGTERVVVNYKMKQKGD